MNLLHLAAIESGLHVSSGCVPQQKPRTEATSLLTRGASKKRHDHETLKLQPSVSLPKANSARQLVGGRRTDPKDEVEKWGENG